MSSPTPFYRKCSEIFVHSVNASVFLFLDLLDSVFCVLYFVLDWFFEGRVSSCYCTVREQSDGIGGSEDEEAIVSETLQGRDNVFRGLGIVPCVRNIVSPRERKETEYGGGDKMLTRWSDCGCDSCVSWRNRGGEKLHIAVKEPTSVISEEGIEKPIENVILLHGFLASSSLWTETVFQNLSESAEANYRLFAVDLLGFGKSPKPQDCLYTIRDHVSMIHKSVISPYELTSFHIVAHSMGCIIALALVSKYHASVKSITLTAPVSKVCFFKYQTPTIRSSACIFFTMQPCFPSQNSDASLTALKRFAEKKLWPPLQFGSAVMSWYEHLGRCVCFLFCRNHRTWEKILKLLTGTRELPFALIDLPRHTHHSAWHSMHNVICGGAKLVDGYMETLANNSDRVKVCVIHGDRDEVVPLECSVKLKEKIPDAKLNIILNTDHNTVIFGRKKDFTLCLEQVWRSTSTI